MASFSGRFNGFNEFKFQPLVFLPGFRPLGSHRLWGSAKGSLINCRCSEERIKGRERRGGRGFGDTPDVQGMCTCWHQECHPYRQTHTFLHISPRVGKAKQRVQQGLTPETHDPRLCLNHISTRRQKLPWWTPANSTGS